MTDRTLAEKQARAERVAAALRANLRKRKEQARARTQEPASGQDSAPAARTHPDDSHC
jgi:hypothetical protein